MRQETEREPPRKPAKARGRPGGLRGRGDPGREATPGPDRSDWPALAAGALLLAITAAWWGFALWPAGSATPEWLSRARAVCFGTTASGLPDASGWILLVGQPLGMFGLLVVGWGRRVGRGLRALALGGAGRGVLATVALGVAVGAGGVGLRVASAVEASTFRPPTDQLPSPDHPRIDRPAPDVVLVDQHGDPVSLADYRGRPVMVTFAFGHCETLCPVTVQRVLSAREELEEELDPAIVVITLDPWRDRPSRLTHIAGKWGLPEGARVLSGPVERVQAALDAWQVSRRRDETTGDIVHPALVYLVDEEGTVAYASTGGVRALVELAGRM